MLRQLIALVVAAVLGVGLVGCGGGGGGPDLVGVKGKVTYKGEALAGATVSFISEKGTPAVGSTDSAGAFSLSTNGKPGAAKGEYRVGVTKTASATGSANPSPEDMMKMMKGGKMPATKAEIPAKFGDPKKSGLTATVGSDASKNDFTFELKE